MKLRRCHRHRHGGERAGDGAQERVTKGPRLQKASFMLNLTHTLCLLSRAGTPDKNLSGLAATPFFSLEVSKSKCFLMHPLNSNTKLLRPKKKQTNKKRRGNSASGSSALLQLNLFPPFCSKPFSESEGCTPNASFDQMKGPEVP